MKIYTKTGDTGETGLYGGGRVRKDAPRIEAIGAVDELNAWLGVVRAGNIPVELDALLARLQNELFEVGAELASTDAPARGTSTIGPPQIDALEQAIDTFESRLAPLRQFILPGGSRTAAELHLARTVCRRAERRLIRLMASAEAAESHSPYLLAYLNRLSDLLFVLARSANAMVGLADVPWQK